MSAAIVTDETEIPCIAKEDVDVPNDIELSSLAVEIALHPCKNVLAAGTIDGPVKLYSYTADKSKSNHKLMSFRHHKESCRAVQFSNCGNFLFSGSSDTTTNAIDLNAGAVTRRLTFSNGAAIYCLLPVDDYLLASGDDDGRIIVWDFRREIPVMSLKPCAEYISCLAVSSDKRTLLATSGEGTLSAFNLRSLRLELQSELFTNEFLTVAVLKKNTKVVVGASDGALNIFNWGEWGNISDRFPFHSGSVDAIVPISDDIICAGCEDGIIRAVHIHPNFNIGDVGNHNDIPVEGLSVSHDRKFLAGCSYDRKIKFHALSVIRNMKSEPGEINIRKRKKSVKLEYNEFYKDLN